MIYLYLDQNFYSNIARGSSDSRLLDRLRSLVVDGTVVAPVSFAHFVETCRWPDREQREYAIEIMVELSRGACLPNIADVIEAEATGAKAPRVGGVVTMFPASARAHLLFMMLLEHGDPAQSMRFAFNECALDANLLASVGRFDEATLSALASAGRQTMPPNVHGTTAYVHQLSRLRTADPNRKAKTGDARDLLHASYAIQAPLALLERSHATLARRAGHPNAFGRAQDLLQALERPETLLSVPGGPARPRES